MVDFGGGPSLDLIAALGEAADEVQVVVEFTLGMMAARDVDFGQVGVMVLLDVSPHVRELHVPHALFAETALKAAEGAADVADVGLRQPERVHEVGLVADLLPPHMVGQPGDGGQVGRVKERHPLGERQPPPGEHLIGDGPERRVTDALERVQGSGHDALL